MYINYNTVNGIEYGTLTSSVRSGHKVGKSGRFAFYYSLDYNNCREYIGSEVLL